TESYQTPLFEYAQQRHANERSWDEYAAQARRRGREAIAAIESAYPRATVLLTFGYALPWRLTENGTRPLSESRYGLLAPFLDGVVEGARGAQLVDGYEMSYGFKKP